MAHCPGQQSCLGAMCKVFSWTLSLPFEAMWAFLWVLGLNWVGTRGYPMDTRLPSQNPVGIPLVLNMPQGQPWLLAFQKVSNQGTF